MTKFPGNDDAYSTGPLLQQGNRRAINLAKGTSLRDITAIVNAENPAEDICILLFEILPSLPEDVTLDFCTVVMHPDVDDYAPSDPEETDEDEDTEEMGSALADGFSSDECTSFDDVEIPCDVLTLRLLHPLRWDEHLYEGVGALRDAGIPLKLEYTTGSGAVCPYSPSDE